MHRAGKEVLAGADLLVPVPLHWTRLFQRRYNQAALLAQAIRSAGGPDVEIGWFAAAAPRPKVTSDPWRASATCAAPLCCERAAASRASGW
jgi:predicted amidophosphoribosyltransferase